MEEQGILFFMNTNERSHYPPTFYFFTLFKFHFCFFYELFFKLSGNKGEELGLSSKQENIIQNII